MTEGQRNSDRVLTKSHRLQFQTLAIFQILLARFTGPLNKKCMNSYYHYCVHCQCSLVMVLL